MKINRNSKLVSRGLQASSTIELSFIMPVVLIIMVTLIYLSLFLYNRVVISRTAYIAALRASQLELESSSKQRQEAEDTIKECLSKELFGTKSYHKEVNVNLQRVSVSISIQQAPFFEYEVTKKSKILNPVRTMRLIKLGKEVLQTIE